MQTLITTSSTVGSESFVSDDAIQVGQPKQPKVIAKMKNLALLGVRIWAFSFIRPSANHPNYPRIYRSVPKVQGGGEGAWPPAQAA